jgi:hypothetical protein
MVKFRDALNRIKKGAIIFQRAQSLKSVENVLNAVCVLKMSSPFLGQLDLGDRQASGDCDFFQGVSACQPKGSEFINRGKTVRFVCNRVQSCYLLTLIEHGNSLEPPQFH